MSTTEAKNKELVRQFVDDVFNDGNLDRLEEHVTADYVEHTPTAPVDPKGPDAVREYYDDLHTAFPDLEVTIQDHIADGDRVCQRSTQAATHEGTFFDIEPTGVSGEISGMIIYRIEDGMIAESWAQADNLGLMQQLGVLELPGE